MYYYNKKLYQNTMHRIIIINIDTTKMRYRLNSDAFPILLTLIIMSTFVSISFTSSVSNITIQIFDQNQIASIDLQKYFDLAKYADIIDEESTPNYKDYLQVNTTKVPVKRAFSIPMQVLEKSSKQQGDKLVRLSDYKIYMQKSIYNQPLKIFLLEKNYIMILLYIEHCRDRLGQNKVIGFNISQNLSNNYKDLNCTSMQTQILQSSSFYLLVSCKYTEGSSSSFLIAGLQFTTDSSGFINGIKLSAKNNVTIIVRKTSYCDAYSLKNLPKLIISNTSTPAYVYAYCSESKKSHSNNIFPFYGLVQINITPNKQMMQCLDNASYIEAYESGFVSIKQNQLVQYLNNYLGKGAACLYQGIYIQQYLFAAHRNYSGIQTSFILLKNNSIILKSSYRTNYQIIPLELPDFQFTSYTLNQHFLGVCLSNGQNSFVLIYHIEELNIRTVDALPFGNLTDQNGFFLLSTDNYLEKGFYYFQFDRTDNILSLKQYVGYQLSIASKYSIPMNNIRNNAVSQSYTICLEVDDDVDKKIQKLYIKVLLRSYRTPTIEFVNSASKYLIEQPFININMFDVGLGPIQRYYFGRSPSNSTYKNDIFFQYINYYEQIQIGHYFLMSTKSKKYHRTLNNNVLLEQLKAVTINHGLKTSQPPLILYYDTFIQNCVLKYEHTNYAVGLICNPDQIVAYKSNLKSPLKKQIITLQKDKWLQYNQTYIELCLILSDGGSCSSLQLSLVPLLILNKIKLVNFQSRPNGYINIQLFIICVQELYYGYFRKESATKGQGFKYHDVFKITQEQVEEFSYMELMDVHYDPKYKRYILLHLEDTGDFKNNVALLFDRPDDNGGNARFIAHLIKKFDSGQIQAFLTVGDDYVITVEMTPNGQGKLTEYKVSDYYQAFAIRNYPLFDYRILRDGFHKSDGSFIYIQVQSDNQSKLHLVYCPNLDSSNLLTHRLYSQNSSIKFLQSIGQYPGTFPHSIGIKDTKLFSLSTPNIVFNFNNNNIVDSQVERIGGEIPLAVVGYDNFLHQLLLTYKFANLTEIITYNVKQQETIYVKNISNAIITHTLNSSKIGGPVISYQFSAVDQSCQFLTPNYLINDVFTKKRCLLDNSTMIYGKIMDFVSIKMDEGYTLEIIITSENLLCVENRTVVTITQMPPSKSCAITNQRKNKMFIVCDEGQQTVIKFYQIFPRCYLSRLVSIDKPIWNTYRYFKLKYAAPYIVFEIPIRQQSNNIYFLTKFNDTSNEFDGNPLQIFHTKINFLTKDFAIDFDHFYLLEDGLGVYPLNPQVQQTNSKQFTDLHPIVWIQLQQLLQKLNTTQQLVYVQSIFEQHQQLEQQQQSKAFEQNKQQETIIKYLQIGAQTVSYKIKLTIKKKQTHQYVEKISDKMRTRQLIENSLNFDVFQNENNEVEGNNLTDIIPYEYQIEKLVIYKQQKNCKNTIASKSKTWKGNIIKMCSYEQPSQEIFSNYVPLSEIGIKNYIQFYRIIDNTNQVKQYFPFRMQSINSGDIFQISQNLTKAELIVTSYFNFLCYYDLSSNITWKLFIKNPTTSYQKYSSQQDNNSRCSFKVLLYNSHYQTSYNFSVIYDPDLGNVFWQAWIFRAFFIMLVVIFIVKLQRQKNKKNNIERKISKFSTNIYSKQFEIKVKMNTKKSLGSFIEQEESSSRQKSQNMMMK